MPTRIIYHQVKKGTDCPDGIFAAAIAAYAHDFDCEIYGDSYRHNDDYPTVPNPSFPVEAGDKLIIVDFSYPAHWLRYWEDLGAHVTVIDHHAPKFPMLENFSGAILNKDECGATLTWKHFFPDQPMPSILEDVRNRDIGTGGYYKFPSPPRTHAINEGLSKYRHGLHGSLKENLQSLIWVLAEDEWEWLENVGKPIVEERDRLIAEVSQRARPARLDGHVCGKIELQKHEDRHVSMIGTAVAHQHPEWQFAWLITSDGRCHLRSCNGFDVSVIAANHGGGGHAAAAGWTDKE